MRAIAVAAAIVGLVLAFVGLSTTSGFSVVPRGPLPLRFAVALTPYGLVAGRVGGGERWRRVEAHPAARRGFPHDPAMIAYEVLLLASALPLLVMLRSRRGTPS